MGVSSFLVLAGTMENTPFTFLPQDFTQKILRYRLPAFVDFMERGCHSPVAGERRFYYGLTR
jgi:hypothetical protein